MYCLLASSPGKHPGPFHCCQPRHRPPCNTRPHTGQHRLSWGPSRSDSTDSEIYQPPGRTEGQEQGLCV